MNRLFVIARKVVSDSSDIRLDLPQVHAFNIIKQLMQDSKLVGMMRPFIADSFILSINGFKSNR